MPEFRPVEIGGKVCPSFSFGHHLLIFEDNSLVSNIDTYVSISQGSLVFVLQHRLKVEEVHNQLISLEMSLPIFPLFAILS